MLSKQESIVLKGVAILIMLFLHLFNRSLLLFATLKRPKWLDFFLSKMGEQSTNMWLIHTFFCYYLFKNFIYGFKYPLVIYIVLLVMSYLSALVVDWINQPLQRIIKRRF